MRTPLTGTFSMQLITAPKLQRHMLSITARRVLPKRPKLGLPNVALPTAVFFKEDVPSRERDSGLEAIIASQPTEQFHTHLLVIK